MQELHPIIDSYCEDISVENIDRRVKQMDKSTDDIFKKEMQCTNDKRHENEVVVGLNEDQH